MLHETGLAPTSVAARCWLEREKQAGRAVARCAAVSLADGRLSRLLGG